MAQKLTDKQEAFIEHYIENRFNATRAAQAVYDTDDYDTARTIGSENIAKPHIRAEIDRRLESLLPKPEEIIRLHQEIAYDADLAHFIDDQGHFDLRKALKAGKTHLVRRLTRDPKNLGEKVTLELYDRQRSLDSLARIYGLDSGRLELDASDKLQELLGDAMLPWQSVQDAQEEDAEPAEEPEDDEDEAE